MIGSVIKKLGIILEMIKFEHTIFALPFAMISMLIASKGLPNLYHVGSGFAIPPLKIFVWILVAMVGARSAAMAFNRIADANVDTVNPRTSTRAIPKGLVSKSAAWVFVIVSGMLLVFAAYMLNPLAFALSPVALAVVMLYSYTKRFTSLSHLWLGLSLGIAPVGAWIAVTGKIGFPSMVLSAAVMLWTAGFDIIYSLQDIDFDKMNGLFSIPARLGASKALLVSSAFHAFMVALLIWFGLLCGLGYIYWVGVAIVAGFLIYEHSIVSPKDLSRVNAAFFTLNGCVSIVLLIFVMADLFI